MVFLSAIVSDIQEFYELTLLDDSKSIQQKTAETNQIANKWEATNGPISLYSNNNVSTRIPFHLQVYVFLFHSVRHHTHQRGVIKTKNQHRFTYLFLRVWNVVFFLLRRRYTYKYVAYFKYTQMRHIRGVEFAEWSNLRIDAMWDFTPLKFARLSKKNVCMCVGGKCERGEWDSGKTTRETYRIHIRWHT